MQYQVTHTGRRDKAGSKTGQDGHRSKARHTRRQHVRRQGKSGMKAHSAVGARQGRQLGRLGTGGRQVGHGRAQKGMQVKQAASRAKQTGRKVGILAVSHF
jgi:hypothetical protein